MSEPVIDTADRSIYERVHAILSELPAIGKNSQAPGAMGGYKFRGIEDITAALKPLLAKHGVFMVPTVVNRVDTERQTANGKALYVVDLLVRFTFYDIAGHDRFPGGFNAEVWGQGSDSGDKATQKAMTSAFKTMLGITFCISDAENDAERHEVPETEPRRTTHPASASKRAHLKSRASALIAAKVSVADERAAQGLPTIDNSDADELERWDTMLTRLEQLLPAVPA